MWNNRVSKEFHLFILFVALKVKYRNFFYVIYHKKITNKRNNNKWIQRKKPIIQYMIYSDNNICETS